MKIADIPCVLFKEFSDSESIVRGKGKYNQDIATAHLKSMPHLVSRVETTSVYSSIQVLYEGVSGEHRRGNENDRMLLSVHSSQILDPASWVKGKGYKIREFFAFEFPFLEDEPLHGFSLRYKDAPLIFSILQRASEYAQCAESLDERYQADVEPTGAYDEDYYRKEHEAYKKRQEELSKRWWHRFLPMSATRAHIDEDS